MYLAEFLYQFSWHHTYPIIERKLFAASKYQVVNGFIFTNHSLFQPSVTKGYGLALIIFISFDLRKWSVYALNLFIEHSGEHWWEQNVSPRSPQAFWQSSAPCALRTLVTSVVVYSLTRAPLMGPGKDEISLFLSLSLSLYIYIYR